MPYSADTPSRAKSSEELPNTIPGWGVDLDPANRPNLPARAVRPRRHRRPLGHPRPATGLGGASNPSSTAA